MKPSATAFKHNIFNIDHKKGTFPLSSNGDYSAVTSLTKKQMLSWPENRFQMYMDYCLAKEIYEVASVIRDVAVIRSIRLKIAA